MADTLYQLAGQLGVDMLLPASFRGVEFDCLYTREVLARDTVVYEYPWRDGAEVEDHGLKALNLRLSALFWGNGYQARIKAFLAALKAPGPGELLHPVYGSLPRVQLLEAGVEHEVEPLNAVTIELVFVEASTEQALFAPVSTTPRTGGLLDSVTAGLSDALAAIRRGNEGIARISNLVASAEYVVQALADEVQTSVGSVMNYLDMPTAFVSDLKGLLSAFSDRLNFSEVTRLSDWLAVRSQGERLAGFADRRMTTNVVDGQGGVFASTLNRASIMPQADRELINQTVRLVTIAEWVDVAADIFQAEEETPTLSGSDIERLCEEVRGLIVTAIVTQRTVMDTRQRTAHQTRDVTPDVRNDSQLIAALQQLAYQLQSQARTLIVRRPQRVLRQVTRACNLHLLAFEWYGDAGRGLELARLNPTLRNPNALQPGDRLYAFAR